MVMSPLLEPKRAGKPSLFRQIMGNAAWLVADKIIRILAGLLVGVWLARYLGPERLGTLSYAQAYVALFTSVAALGLEGIVIRDVLLLPEKRDETLGTAFYLKLTGGFASFLLAVVSIYVIHPADRLTMVLVAIIAFGNIFQAFEVMDFWFQSQTRSKYPVIARDAAFLTISAVKVLLIIGGASLEAFAVAGVVEILLGSIGLLYIYRRYGSLPVFWRGSFKRAGELLRQSWPLIISGLSVMIYMRIALIMLREMGTGHDVGIYSVASKLSEMWYFIPTAMVASVFPSIVSVRESDPILYNQRLQKLLRIMALMAYGIVIPVSLFSGQITTLLYGAAYAEAAPILATHVWVAVFVFIGVAQGPWNIAEGLMKLSLQRTLAGAVCNIALNMLLIPHYKGLGAAVATLVSQALSAYVMNLFDSRTRNVFYKQSSALFLVNRN